jgi:FkbM family methyltransferase
MTFYSQWGQDAYLKNHVFKEFKGGFFVDVGAHDGVSINNTLYFERNDGWTGINVEPLRDVYERLVTNRPSCINLNVAVDDTDGEAEFSANSGYPEMLSGLQKYYDPRHVGRIQHEARVYKGAANIVKMPTLRLETIFDTHNVKHVHYMSIDVEGGEFAVIKSINFDKVFIDVIEFENNYRDVSVPIVEYLISKNYRQIKGGADIFMIHNDSQFNPVASE